MRAAHEFSRPEETMPNQIPTSEVAAGFRFLLEETFESVHGAYLDPGTSLFETLATISASQASQPMGDCATIAAHVAHVHYYLGVLGRSHVRPRSRALWTGSGFGRK